MFSAAPFGYRTYTFTLASRVDQLDKNIVLMTLQNDDSTHAFNWQNGSVQFTRYQGPTPTISSEIEAWSYSGSDIPPPATGHARINLWLLKGAPPSNPLDAEVIIQRFEFVPQSP